MFELAVFLGFAFVALIPATIVMGCFCPDLAIKALFILAIMGSFSHIIFKADKRRSEEASGEKLVSVRHKNFDESAL